MKFKKWNWAKLMEYLYTGKSWNLKGWFGKVFFGEDKEFQGRLALVKKLIAHHGKPKIILDVMCSGAYPSRYLAGNNNDSFICIDVDADYLSFAKYEIKKEKLKNRIELIQADARYLPLKDKSINVTLNIGGLEYLSDEDLEEHLSEVKRVTNEKIIFTFTSEKLKKMFYYKIKLPQLSMLLGGIKYHKLYTKERCLRLFLDYNFQNPQIYESGKWNIAVRAGV